MSNEATFEARLHEQLLRIFPSIDPDRLTHQDHFFVRLGHQQVDVDGKARDALRGRSDMIICLDDGPPMAVLELKAPGVALTDDDRDQGISYARLLETIAPLVVITNGQDTQLYNTFTRERIDGDTIGESTVRHLFENAAHIAESELDGAVRALLAHRPELWRAEIRTMTEAVLTSKTGPVDHPGYPLCDQFFVHRVATAAAVGGLIAGGQRTILITGDPLGGKTNAAALLCRNFSVQLSPSVTGEREAVFLYVDTRVTAAGIFRHLANHLAERLFLRPDVEEVRRWLMDSLQASPAARNDVVIVVDGYGPDATGPVEADISELASWAAAARIGLVLVVDSAFAEVLAHEPGRPTLTLWGRTHRVELQPLSIAEFEAACQQADEDCGVIICPGAELNENLWQPRALRALVSEARSRARTGSAVILSGNAALAAPIITPGVIEFARRFVGVNGELQDAFEELAKAALAEAKDRAEDERYFLMALGRGLLKRRTLRRNLSETQIRLLTDVGYLRNHIGPGGEPLVQIVAPEAFAGSGAESLADAIREAAEGFTATAFVEAARAFPLWDAAAAGCLLRLRGLRSQAYEGLLTSLLAAQPFYNDAAGNRGLAYTEEVGFVEFEYAEGDRSVDSFAWIILSQFAVGLVENAPRGVSDIDWDLFFQVFPVVGNAPCALRRTDRVSEKVGLETFAVPGFGSVLSPDQGIVEPITYALLLAILHRPEQVIEVVRAVTPLERFYLTVRLETAARWCLRLDMGEGSVQAICRELQDRLRIALEGIPPAEDVVSGI